MRSGLFLTLIVVAGCSSTGTPAATTGGAQPASAEPQTAAGAGAAAAPAPAPARTPGNQQPAFDDRPAIAVFPFANGGSYGQDAENFEALEIGVQQMLLTELAQNSALRIVERSLIRDIIAEQDLGASGRVDPQTAASVGKLVGARYIVTGQFTDLYGDFRMDGRIINVETGEIVGTEQVRARREQLYDLLVDLAGRMTAGVDLPPLPANVRAARLDREIPSEAVTLYSRAQVYQDAGRTDRAIELYRSIADQFPEMTEAREALRQLGGA
jgi:curli biogenesis system outer membrane secretion channel CsgG